MSAWFQLENWNAQARLETLSARLSSAREISSRTLRHENKDTLCFIINFNLLWSYNLRSVLLVPRSTFTRKNSPFSLQNNNGLSDFDLCNVMRRTQSECQGCIKFERIFYQSLKPSRGALFNPTCPRAAQIKIDKLYSFSIIHNSPHNNINGKRKKWYAIMLKIILHCATHISQHLAGWVIWWDTYKTFLT